MQRPDFYPEALVSSMSYSVLSDVQNNPYHFRLAWADVVGLNEAAHVRVETFQYQNDPAYMSVVMAFDSQHPDYEKQYATALMFGDHPELVDAFLNAIYDRKRERAASSRREAVGTIALGVALTVVRPEHHIALMWRAFRSYSSSVQQPVNGSLLVAS